MFADTTTAAAPARPMRLLCCVSLLLLALASCAPVAECGTRQPGLFHAEDGTQGFENRESRTVASNKAAQQAAAQAAAKAQQSDGAEFVSSAPPAVQALCFENLSEEELLEHYSHPPAMLPSEPTASGLPTALSQLGALAAPLSSTLLVDVWLVGFAGDGDTGVVVSAMDLGRYLQAAGMATEQARYTVEAIEGQAEEKAGGHELPFATKFLYRVQQAHPSLRSRLQLALQNAVDSTVEENPHIVLAPLAAPVAKGKMRAKPKEPTIPISASTIDGIIQEDYEENGLATSIYVLNLAAVYLKPEPKSKPGQAQPPGFEEEEPQRLRYVYTQSNSSSSGPAEFGGACPTSYNASPTLRYLWIDLSAGPISYGPQTWGDGIVTEFALPNTRRMMETQIKYERKTWRLNSIPADGISTVDTQPFKPSPTLNTHFRHQLLSELALVVSKVTAGILQPPAAFWPLPRSQRLKIVMTFVHERHAVASTAETEEQIKREQLKKQQQLNVEIARMAKKQGAVISSSSHSSEGGDDGAGATSEQAAWGLYPDGSAAPSSSPDGASSDNGWEQWAVLERALLDLALPGQIVEIQNQHLRFEECAQCVEAFTHSLRTTTSNIMAEDQQAAAAREGVTAAAAAAVHAGLKTQVSQYLDSTELKDWLEHFDSRFWHGRSPTGSTEDAPTPGTRVLRVFIYDLATEGIVLLDRFHQSIAFPRDNLVLAVQTRAPKALVDFSCDARVTGFDPRDSSRALLGSLLTAGWGIAPSFQRWSPGLKDTENDFLFSTSNTPYGYFSESKGLHFGIKDAAARHVILSEVDASMRALSSLFPSLRSSRSSSAASPPLLSRTPPSSVLDPLLYSSPSLDFIRRWNVLSFHQQRLAHWINLNHLPQAWLYAQAARHDAEQMASLIRKEVTRIRASLQCDQDEETVESLAGLPLAAPSSASSASSALSASHYLFFVSLELLMLGGIVVFFWMLSSYPHTVVPIIAKCLPQQIVQAIGLNRIGKRKD